MYKRQPEDLARAHDLGLNILLCLAQALGSRNHSQPLRIGVLGTAIHALTATELPLPERSTLLSLIHI